MQDHLFFYLGLLFILLHEMDAIRRQEWKMFPFVSHLNERTAYVIFVSLHLPLYGLIFLGLGSGQSVAETLILGLDVFFIIHVGLHLLLKNHRNNQFKNSFSWGLILLAGFFGLLDLLTAI